MSRNKHREERKVGTLFEQIREKNPEAAQALENLGRHPNSPKTTAPLAPLARKPSTPPIPKQPSRPAGNPLATLGELISKNLPTQVRQLASFPPGTSSQKLRVENKEKEDEKEREIVRQKTAPPPPALKPPPPKPQSTQHDIHRTSKITGVQQGKPPNPVVESPPKAVSPVQPERPHREASSPPKSPSPKCLPQEPIDPWIQGQWETQFSSLRTSEKCVLVIGLDFGTSCTKAVIGSPYFMNRALAVPFQVLQQNPYFLPTRIHFDVSEEMSILNTGGGLAFPNLKWELMTNPEAVFPEFFKFQMGVNANIAATCFLAYALRRIRSWFLTEQKGGYSKFQLDWQFNLGIPARDYNDAKRLDNFRRVAQAAWKLSVHASKLSLQAAREFFRDVDKPGFHPGLDPDYIQVVPEVLAEFSGFAKSRLRRDGMHILVDVGATTLDVCSFHMYQEKGEDRYAFLTADVKNLGCLQLHKRRLSKLKIRLGTHFTARFNCDEVTFLPIPESPAAYGKGDLINRIVRTVDREFKEECMRVLIKTLRDLHDIRFATSLAWDRGVPTLCCGGGSHSVFFKNLISSVDDWVRSQYRTELIQFKLPKPDNLVAPMLSTGDYHRLVVAVGLAVPFDDLGGIEPISQVKNIPREENYYPATRKSRNSYIDKDMC